MNSLTTKALDMSGDSIIALIAANLAPNLPLHGFGKIVAILTWSLAESANEAMYRELESWLEGDDERLAALALSNDEIFYYPSRDQMESVLLALKLRFPGLSARIDEIVLARRQRIEPVSGGA